MNRLTGLGLLLQDARHDGWRSLLTILALSLVLITYLATAALAGAFAGIRKTGLTGPHNLLVLSAEVLDLTDSELFPPDLEAAARAAGDYSPGTVTKISTLILRHLRIDGRIFQVTAAPLGDLQDIYQATLVEGDWPRQAGEVVITRQVVALAGNGPGSAISIYGSPFRVAGVVDVPGNRGGIWMSYPDGQALFGEARGFQVGVLQLNPLADPAAVQAFMEANPTLAGMAVYQEKQFAAEFSISMADLAALARVFNLLALLVISFGAYNITQVSLVERSHEIGVLRAIGFSPASLHRILLVRTLFFTLAAFVLAWLAMTVYFGLQSEPLVVYVSTLEMELTPGQTALALALSLVCSGLGAYLPGAVLFNRPAAELVGEVA